MDMCSHLKLILALLLAVSLPACGKSVAPDVELGTVSGIVTLDGQPLAGAEVSFTPVQKGAMSYATTDQAGKYELIYSPDIQGAVLGSHEVRISKVGGPDTNFDTIEMLPARYNSQTTLSAEVKAGQNKIDFPLENKAGKSP